MTTGISTLVAAQSTLRALCKVAESAGISPFNLPVHWIASWLKGHRERGPTVPLNSLNSLKWLHAHLGFRFHVSEELVLALVAPGKVLVGQFCVPLWLRTLSSSLAPRTGPAR